MYWNITTKESNTDILNNTSNRMTSFKDSQHDGSKVLYKHVKVRNAFCILKVFFRVGSTQTSIQNTCIFLSA